MKRSRVPNSVRKREVSEAKIPRRTLSFYRYVRIADPKAMRDLLYGKFMELGCLGRIYVAGEGINAQMNVPCARFDAFDAYLNSLPEFANMPYKLAVEETDVVSFYKLTVKVREKIVADGLDDASFDVTKTGEYLTAREMNAYVDDPDAVIVDMRNGYESEVGHFENAITPDVDTFREELEVVPELLRVHKKKKIALYCTGGIRCEKASAWLRHNGFENVKHLRGGIIDYKRQVEEEKLPNRFLGKNFVFDERLGERISGEVIAHCHLCNTAKCDEHTHCRNDACHALFICCPSCNARLNGYCSYRCRLFDALPSGIKTRLTRNDHKKREVRYRKRRLRSV
ncbi:MAG TPA: rhodanese-related sulfurtransferase [Candidatus Paceibacterota bacterium]|nr:rhodanese-related sulfurtransferase [Candidatus Paceibacterota bacterium]